MNQISLMLTMIFLPLAAGGVLLAAPGRRPFVKVAAASFALIVTGVDLAIAIMLFGKEATFSLPWAAPVFELSFRLYSFNGFITLAVAAFSLCATIYGIPFLSRKEYATRFYAFLLLTVGLVNGAVLADNFVALLFFWEGLLLTLFGMIAIGGKTSFRTATKAFIIVGISDLAMMVGIVIAGGIAGTLTISKMTVPVEGFGALAFLLLMAGTLAKGGAIPFHTWIPDAATDAPLPFMALIPAAVEKLIGIYFLARLSIDIFRLDPGSWASYLLMFIGAVTIVIAVMMALIQKEYKRLLSYHAISQLGYMILGIGTALPVGIVGGLFHMLNNALYKCCLFFTAGAVEKETGTTTLDALGGLGRRMPVTFASFIVAALAISGVPPFNGFFSKELVYDAALESGRFFYLAAVVGSFFTAASFLKLGHAAFLGPVSEKNNAVREAPLGMLAPMVALAGACIFFGIYHALPVNLLKAIAPRAAAPEEVFEFAMNPILVVITLTVLVGAVINHLYGVRRGGSGAKASDHIHYAPVLAPVYERAERGWFDPYVLGWKAVTVCAAALSRCDKAVDWIYNGFSVTASYGTANLLKRLHTGNYKTYILWSTVASAIVAVVFLMRSP